MTAGRRTGAALATLFGLALAFGLVYAIAVRPNWPSADDMNFVRIAAEADALQAQEERLRRGAELGDRLVLQLAAGKLTLALATEQLEPHLRSMPGFEDNCKFRWYAPSPRHGTARYLIDKVRRVLADDPSRWAVVSAGSKPSTKPLGERVRRPPSS